MNHRLVRVALFALVVDDAFSREARRLLGEGAVLVDGVGDRGVDAARFQFTRVRRPDIEILAAVSGRGVNEARTSLVSDMIAFQKGNFESVAIAQISKR